MQLINIMQSNLLERSIEDSFVASFGNVRHVSRLLFHNRFLENFAVLEQLLHIGAFTGVK